jgi:hypothetical protein
MGEAELARACNRLAAQPLPLSALRAEQRALWSRAAVAEELGCGWEHGRLLIPIRDGSRALCGALRYVPRHDRAAKMLAVAATPLGLIPHPAAEPSEWLMPLVTVEREREIRHYTDQPLSPQLDAIAHAAADRLRAHCGDDPTTADEHAHRVADGIGEGRARTELRTDILRKVERAAKRKLETDTDYDQAIERAARLGLSHRDIATAAQVTHGTIRAVPARTDSHTAEAQPTAEQRDDGAPSDEHAPEPLAA